MSELKPLNGSFKLILKMDSDWHVGAGIGRPGDVDSLVRRDAEGLPFVPAKTLTGIWRDACETVAFGLDGGDENGVWNKLLQYVFGEQSKKNDDQDNSRLTAPSRSLISVRAAQLPKELRDAVKAKPYLSDAVTFVKPGVAIDLNTGCAKPKYLRFEEMARGGAELTADVELHVSEETRKAATALLVAGARFVERVGGKRRRGAGRCEMMIKDLAESEINAWFEWIEKNPKPIPPPEPVAQSAADRKLEERASGGWVRIPLVIVTQTPVVVPERTVGNLVRTLDYFPGTYLLRFITEKFDSLGLDVRSAVAHGDLVITNATRAIHQQPGRPTPLNLYYKKLLGGLSKGEGVLNRFEETEPGPQLKPQRGGYVGRTGGKSLPEYAKTSTSVETHNVVEDQKQRPTSNVGGVFSYESINRDTELRAELRLRQTLVDDLDKIETGWRQKLSGNGYRIGRARKDDYGVVTITALEPSAADERVEGNNDIPDEIRVWLLSDVLLRDKRLRPTTSIARFAQELGSQLGVTLSLRKTKDFDCREESPRLMNFAVRPHRTDSWNTAWVRARPSLVGLSAGSSFVFKVTKPPTDATEFNKRLKEIEAGGIGERRAEGYGQLRFDDVLLSAVFEGIRTPRHKNQPQSKDIRIPSTDYAHRIETEGWRKEIRRRALDKARTRAGRKEVMGILLESEQSKPRMSQLGALRSVIEQVRDRKDAGQVTDWIAHLKKSENRKKDWPNGSLDLIEKLVTDQTVVRELLKDDQVDFVEFTITQDGETTLWNELWAEAVRTLVDACVRAQKRDLEEMQKQAGK